MPLSDHVLIVLVKIKVALLHQHIGNRFNVKAANNSRIYEKLLLGNFPNAWKIILHGKTKEQLEGHFQNVFERSFVTTFALYKEVLYKKE